MRTPYLSSRKYTLAAKLSHPVQLCGGDDRAAVLASYASVSEQQQQLSIPWATAGQVTPSQVILVSLVCGSPPPALCRLRMEEDGKLNTTCLGLPLLVVHDAGHPANDSSASSSWAGSALFPPAAARCVQNGARLPPYLLCTCCLLLAALSPFPATHNTLPCCAVYGLPGAPYGNLAYYPGAQEYGQDYGQGRCLKLSWLLSWLLKSTYFL